MKIKYTCKEYLGKVKLGSQFRICNNIYTRYIEGWKFQGQQDICHDTNIIDSHYLKGTYKVIK